jgi:DNA-binding MarR family transcriptional regulator
MRRRATSGKVLTELILEVFRLNGRLLAAGDRLTRPVGQTSARWQVLGAVDREPRSVSEIARVMGLTRQSVQRTADRLQAEGIVAYADNPAHRRARLVTLTPQGRSALDWITQRQIVWANGLGARLGAVEVGRALQVIRAFRQALEQANRKERHRSARGRPPGDRDSIAGAEEGPR